jgi:hypothetical protein
VSDRSHLLVPVAPRNRRLTDKILIAFNQACEQGDLEVAEQLARVLEMIFTRRPLPPDANRRRREMETVVAMQERLWALRHPEAEL